MESELFHKTMKTTGILVGACVAFTGTVALLSALVVGAALGPRETVDEGSGLVPASKVDSQRTPAKTDDAPPPKSNASKADLPPRATRAI